MPRAETCVDCKKQSPLAEDDYALMSTRVGWRLVLVKAPEGGTRREWRCPACWTAHKHGRSEVATAVTPPPGHGDGGGKAGRG